MPAKAAAAAAEPGARVPPARLLGSARRDGRLRVVRLPRVRGPIRRLVLELLLLGGSQSCKFIRRLLLLVDRSGLPESKPKFNPQSFICGTYGAQGCLENNFYFHDLLPASILKLLQCPLLDLERIP